ncbi:MAG: ANTAR domain-containing protein [Clostridium sp.]|nr:ANTAR domain-containing protein [Clostridium sp.]
MTGIIVVLPKQDDARNIKNLLVRNGISVYGACTTGAQAMAMADNLDDGVVICGYRLADMMYSQLWEYLPQNFELLLLASQHVIGSGLLRDGVLSLAMPIKAHELINTVDMMVKSMEGRRRKRREKPRERSRQDTELLKEAKALLMERNHISEEEAHRYLQKCSMDSGTNMVETAQMVLAMMRG